jgi:hypothetical protein
VNSDTLIPTGESADHPDMNRLYYGDNLDVLRGCIDDESVDLVYLRELFEGKLPNIPLVNASAFKKAPKEARGDQNALPF